jgi:regulator of RNase E activity RraA
MSEPVMLKPDTLERLKHIGTGTITTMMMKIASLRLRSVEDVKPLNPANARFVGEAYTIRYVPIREDLQDVASIASPAGRNKGVIDSLPEGCVVMLDMQRNRTCGALGDMLVARMIARGVRALVADGGLRDGDILAGMDLPIFCAAVSPPPSFKALMAVGVQEIIGCGNVMVAPGDIVVGDGSGVVVVPRKYADQVAEMGEEHETLEDYVKRRIVKGEALDGLYPPRDNAKAEYQKWLAAGKPEI